MKKTNYYPAIDLARMFCAMLVVLVHMGMNSHAIVPCMARQAVPFFFIVSGFFYTKKAETAENKKRFTCMYVGSVFLVYLFWILVTFPMTFADYRSLYPDASALQLALTLFRRLFLAGIAPYWYLLVLAETAVVLAIVSSLKSEWPGVVLCIAGLALNILYGFNVQVGPFGWIHRAFYFVFSWENNIIMTGFPFAFLGSVFAKHEESFRIRPIAFIGAYMLVTLAAFILFQRVEGMVGTPAGTIQAILLFLICRNAQLSHVPKSVCKACRNLSSVIFLTHTLWLTLLGQVMGLWEYTALRFILAVLGAVLIAYLLKKIHWKPLNKLFMVR